MNQLLTRISSESPDFFKKIIGIGITLGAVGAALVSLPTIVPALILPPIVSTLGGYFIAAGTVAAAVAKTTVKDQTVLTPPPADTTVTK